MSATLSLDLFRPSILDPVEDDRGDRHHRRAPADDLRAGVRPPLSDAADEAHHDHHHEPAHAGGGLTLDALIVGVWEGLSAHRTVACPACGAEMTPRYGAGPAPVGGRCGGCGTTIA